MLKIENYNKLNGLRFGDWQCGLVTEHPPLYRFSFHKWDDVGKRWKDTFWIEVERNVFTDADGDRVTTLNFPNRKLITRLSIKYMKNMDNIIRNFTDIIQKHAGQ